MEDSSMRYSSKLSRRELLVGSSTALAGLSLLDSYLLSRPAKPLAKGIKTILLNGRILDGMGGQIKRASIVIEDEKITGITKSITPSSQDKVIDCSGMTIMPGMIDMHVHPALPNIKGTAGYFSLQFIKHARTMLDAGFTTIRCLGCPHNVDLDVKRAVREGLVIQPRIFASGLGIGPTNTHLYRLNIGIEVNGVDGFRTAARELIKKKVDLLKISADAITSYATPTVAEMKAAIDVFHLAGKKVAVHAGSPLGIKNAIKAGADTIEHGFRLVEEPRLANLMAEQGIYLVPTLFIHEYWDTDSDSRYSKEILDKVRAVQKIHPKSFQEALRAGVQIAMGSDEGGVPGSPVGEGAYELELMVKYGMKEMDAIVSTNSNAAKALGAGDRLGSIKKGMLADLIVVDGDPIQDIKILKNKNLIKKIFSNGVLVKERS
jgi:imidazolonepropionase-like amidohydrolase